jgi:hypothetical protein
VRIEVVEPQEERSIRVAAQELEPAARDVDGVALDER